MAYRSHCRYMINEFPYDLNVWVLEVFPIFRGFSKYKDQKLPQDLQPFPKDMLCKETSPTKESASLLHILCDVAASTPNGLYGKTNTFSYQRENLGRKERRACNTSCINHSRELEENVKSGLIDLKTPSSNERLPSPNPLEVVTIVEVSRKRQRCEDGIEDDSGFPHWDIITPDKDASTVDKQLSFGTDTNCTTEELR
ncbi:hypothetical protein RND71_034613 [Anisodus tanguticus]|uniref:Uncharacterized protein n=1 Tax=Anisodus tanguticus TaxID=243964 RepID=A0AAE1RBL7_9SOLA|nr:hypothetical protein RND71_034613 [Anisodus tanguticus]